jgi:hypothetical protein
VAQFVRQRETLAPPVVACRVDNGNALALRCDTHTVELTTERFTERSVGDD